VSRYFVDLGYVIEKVEISVNVVVARRESVRERPIHGILCLRWV
jgi:hypothetical protein